MFKDLGERVTDNDIKEMIEEHDHDRDSFLSFDEFVRMMMARWIIVNHKSHNKYYTPVYWKKTKLNTRSLLILHLPNPFLLILKKAWVFIAAATSKIMASLEYNMIIIQDTY